MSEVLTQFLEKTKTRIPTVEEMLSVCDDLNIQFKIIEGKPYMKPCPTCIDEAKVLAKLFKREPFRSKVLGAKLPGIAGNTTEAKAEPLPQEEIEDKPDEEIKKPGPIVPPNAVIVVADKDGYTDKNMKTEPYMWTWIGATTWVYVKDHSIPKRS